MFSPGHLEVHREPQQVGVGIHLCLDYQVCRDESGRHVDFHLSGEVGGRPVADEFRLRDDVVYNFLQNVGRGLRRQGIEAIQPALFALREELSPLFIDLRRQLHSELGDAVDLPRFLMDRGVRE
ncbi:DUF5064 family protein [Aquipseudomonas alcaligenes]|uniref:DUF5064 family protein n=1 Tax=Aquipseudomonas alcaligenes TaxID=43263 RepID=UPI003748E4E2